MREETGHRSGLPRWMRPVTQRLSPLIKRMVIALTLAFLVYLFAEPVRPFVIEYLVLGPGLFRGMVWQVVTSLLVHTEPIEFLFTILGLWFAGAQVERMFGSRRFLVLFFVPAMAGGLAQALVSLAIGQGTISSGAGLGVISLFVTIGVAYGRTPVRVWGALDVEARFLAAVIVGLALLFPAIYGVFQDVAGTAVAAVTSFVLAGGSGRHLRDILPKRGASAERSRYVVLDGGKKRRGGEGGSRYLN